MVARRPNRAATKPGDEDGDGDGWSRTKREEEERGAGPRGWQNDELTCGSRGERSGKDSGWREQSSSTCTARRAAGGRGSGVLLGQPNAARDRSLKRLCDINA